MNKIFSIFLHCYLLSDVIVSWRQIYKKTIDNKYLSLKENRNRENIKKPNADFKFYLKNNV